MLDARVVVVGGGPAGVMLTFLLARAGVDVTLLESRGDFRRRFRGDTLAPAVLDYLDELGLADELLSEVPHAKASAFQWHTATRSLRLADYSTASRRFGYYALIPQELFLDWLSAKATQYPTCRIVMNARVNRLLRDADDRVAGVAYSDSEAAVHQLDADLVVGCDGRNSKVRSLSGAASTELGANIDMLWYQVPRLDHDPELSGLDIFTRPGTLLAVLNQVSRWQLGYAIPAGTFAEVKAAGIDVVKERVVGALPWLAERLGDLHDVNQLSLLPVRITTVDSWFAPGLLLIGDAAHVISPVGGNGINYAIADAAETANRLISSLIPAEPTEGPAGATGRAASRDLIDAALPTIERIRRPPVEKAQRLQVRIERDTRLRLEQQIADPPAFFKLQAAIPGLAKLIGRRTQIAVATPEQRLRG